jgi:alcohol dehydrogenase class IV
MQRGDLDQIRRFLAPEILFGTGTLDAAGQFVRGFGVGRALLVSDPGVARAGWTEHVARSLEDAGITAVVFTNVTPNPKDTEVAAGAAVYRSEACEMIIAVGGGSPIDAAKTIGALVSNKGSVAEFQGIDAIEQPGPPLVSIPTTAGSSADVSQLAIITDTARELKMVLVSKALVSDLTIIDPRTATTMDPRLAADTGLDALVHAIEAYVSTSSSSLTDIHALRAIDLISTHLRDSCLHRTCLVANNQIMQAALHAGLAFSNASLGAIHAMGHALGSQTDGVHGQCVGVLANLVIARNYPFAKSRYDEVARHLATGLGVPCPPPGPGALGQLLDTLKAGIGFAPAVLRFPGLHCHIRPMAQRALADPCMLTNPCEMSLNDLERIYERTLEQ